ncbi:MAG: hypothetical protein MJ247_06365 [Alphaproteobacteria bacterium]|nr:hypothetical protein [Alphaproteobacteria bacterium]
MKKMLGLLFFLFASLYLNDANAASCTSPSEQSAGCSRKGDSCTVPNGSGTCGEYTGNGKLTCGQLNCNSGYFSIGATMGCGATRQTYSASACLPDCCKGSTSSSGTGSSGTGSSGSGSSGSGSYGSGSSSSGSSSSTTTCEAGYFLPEPQAGCQICPYNAYCPKGATTPTSCPTGTSTNGNGKSSVSDCISVGACPSSTSSIQLYSSCPSECGGHCMDCMSNGTKKYMCTACADGYTWVAQSQTCSPISCSSGKTLSTSSSITGCAETYKCFSSGNARYYCYKCKDGYTLNSDGTCSLANNCPSGKTLSSTKTITGCNSTTSCLKNGTTYYYCTSCSAAYELQTNGTCLSGGYSSNGCPSDKLVASSCPKGCPKLLQGCEPCGDNMDGGFFYYCSSCIDGYSLGSNGTCSQTICSTGYVNDGGVCKKCSDLGSNCLECSLGQCELCKPGYEPHHGTYGCVKCGAGMYGDGTGTGCQYCPRGTYQPSEAQSECIPCEKGYLTTYYQNAGTGNTACKKCPDGTTTSTTGNYAEYGSETTVCKCSPSLIDIPNGTCTECSGLLCTKATCASGTTWNSTLQGCDYPASQCTPSNSKFCLSEYGAGSNPCGGYANNIKGCSQWSAASDCCSSGMNVSSNGCRCTGTANPGYHWTAKDKINSPYPIDCEIGYYCTGGTADHTLCPAGKTSNPNAKSESDCFAAAGTSCSKGQYLSSGVCTDCPQGKYQPNDNSTATSCTSCGGAVASCDPVTGSIISCSLGYQKSVSGQCVMPVCRSCDSSQTGITDNVKEICKTCASAYGEHCTKCDCFGCLTCETGYAVNSSGTCGVLSCDSGSYLNATTGACVQCSPGYYQGNVGKTSCFECSVGMYCPNTGMIGEIPCEKGYYNDTTGNTKCKVCPPGSHTTLYGSPKSPYSGIAAQGCEACAPGSYSAGSATECTLCPGGTYANGTGQTSCSNCIAGYKSGSSIGSTSCDICPAGTYSLSASSTCTACSTNSTQCTAGSGAPMQAACQTCASAINVLRGTCYTCDGNCGATNACKTATCVPSTGSVNGTYEFNVSLQACMAKSCDPGYYISDGVCTICPAGSYCPGSTTPAILCSKGTYSNGEGHTSCDMCPAGMYTDTEGSVLCKSCPMGTYSSAPRSIACTTCPAGSHTTGWDTSTKDKATYCTKCDPGTYSTTSTYQCDQCGAGTYAADYGSTSCTECDYGMYQDLTGSISCKECQRGTYTDQKKSSKCTKCQTGTYQDATGQSTCKPCPAGTVTDMEGTIMCEPCQMGYYQGSTGKTSCYQCNSVGTGACHACDSVSGECKNYTCADGMIDDGTKCVKSCVEGQYFNYITKTCDACPAGFICRDNKMEACTGGTVPNATQTACEGCSSQLRVDNGTCTTCDMTGIEPACRNVQCNTDFHAVRKGDTLLCEACKSGTEYTEGPTTYGITDLNLSCKKCSEGFTIENGTCVVCDRPSGSVECRAVACKAGFEPKGNVCGACATGYYKAADDDTNITNASTYSGVACSSCGELTSVKWIVNKLTGGLEEATAAQMALAKTLYTDYKKSGGTLGAYPYVSWSGPLKAIISGSHSADECAINPDVIGLTATCVYPLVQDGLCCRYQVQGAAE